MKYMSEDGHIFQKEEDCTRYENEHDDVRMGKEFENIQKKYDEVCKAEAELDKMMDDFESKWGCAIYMDEEESDDIDDEELEDILSTYYDYLKRVHIL